eukprot:7847303-Ditylum_brightwellii.AAC.1
MCTRCANPQSFQEKNSKKTPWIGICQNKTTKDIQLGDALLIWYPSYSASCVLGPKDVGHMTGPKDRH